MPSGAWRSVWLAPGPRAGRSEYSVDRSWSESASGENCALFASRERSMKPVLAGVNSVPA